MQYPRIGDALYTGLVGRRKIGIEPPVCSHCGTIMVLRARHVQSARLSRTTHQDLALLLRCPHCERVGAMLEGADAERALRHGLTYVNLKKGRRIKRKAEEAASVVEGAGGPQELIAGAARAELAVSSLKGAQGLALEMAVDEQAEVTRPGAEMAPRGGDRRDLRRPAHATRDRRGAEAAQGTASTRRLTLTGPPCGAPLSSFAPMTSQTLPLVQITRDRASSYVRTARPPASRPG